MARETTERYRLADLMLDVGQRRLRRGNEDVRLNRKTFELLLALVRAAPNMASHDDLANCVWGPNRIVTPENLSQHIGLLRRALGDNAAAPRYVEAIRGFGYRLIPAPEVAGPISARARRSWLPVWGLVTLAVLGVIVANILPPGIPGAALFDTSVAIDSRAIAVVPFVNQSPEPEQAFFADGLSEELINRLAQIKGWRVVARTSSFALQGNNADARDLGRQLGVAYLLVGSVRKDDDSLRIIAQLVDATNGFELWSRTYEHELGDIFAIQTDIAGSVAETFRATIAQTDPRQVFGLPATNNAAAYEKFLRARGLMRAGGGPNHSRAEQLLREALDLDPEFFAARAVLAQTMSRITSYYPARAEEARREHLELVAELIAEAPQGAPGHLLHGIELWYSEGDFLGAEQEFETGRKLAPPGELQREAEYVIASIQHITGRFAESLPYSEAAIAADPLSLRESQVLQRTLTILGRDDEADAEYERSRDLQGARATLEIGAVLHALEAGYELPRIERRLQRFLHAMDSEAPGNWPHRFARIVTGNDRDSALQLLREDLSTHSTNTDTIPLYIIAALASFHADTDLALQSLNIWFEQLGRFNGNVWTPIFANLRRTAGFRSIAEQYGVVEYWRETGNWGDFCRPTGSKDFECF